MKKCHIHTFGCQMNFHDSEKMAGLLDAAGYSHTADPEEADLIVFNTCSIRQKAEQKFFSELGKIKSMKKKNPALRVAVAGCIAQQMGGKLFKKARHIDYVLGPQNIDKMPAMLKESSAALLIDENPGLEHLELPAIRKERGRAWVNIMYGCNNFCSYCIVPYTRGRERSRPVKSILKEMQALAEDGCKEVTLLGQNVNSYRGETDFTGLLKEINALDGIERIRFVTSHPRDFNDGLIDSMAGLQKVCEHIHLPLQSGSTGILAFMNRGYTFEQYRLKVEGLRSKVPGVAITSDIIAGFPGETEADHEATMNALRDIGFDGLFAFKYSARPGTPAESMEGQLPEEVRLRRLKEILELQDEITLRKNKALEGDIVEVLVEEHSKTGSRQATACLDGRTRTNKIVNFEGGDSLVNRLVKVRIVKGNRHSLIGELVSRAFNLRLREKG